MQQRFVLRHLSKFCVKKIFHKVVFFSCFLFALFALRIIWKVLVVLSFHLVSIMETTAPENTQIFWKQFLCPGSDLYPLTFHKAEGFYLKMENAKAFCKSIPAKLVHMLQP